MDCNYADFSISRRNNKIKKMAGERVADCFYRRPISISNQFFYGLSDTMRSEYYTIHVDILKVLKYQ